MNLTCITSILSVCLYVCYIFVLFILAVTLYDNLAEVWVFESVDLRENCLGLFNKGFTLGAKAYGINADGLELIPFRQVDFG